MDDQDSYECFRSALHGNGVRATGCISQGTTVFVEKPMCCLQSLPNKQNAIVCGGCLRFIGSTEFQLAVLTRKLKRQDGFSSSSSVTSGETFFTDIIPCRSNCGEYYCSLECQDKHWNVSHKLLCTGYIPDAEAETHPLVKFKYHAVATNEIFLLCADIFASHCVEIENRMLPKSETDTKCTVEEAAAATICKYSDYVRNLWWDVAIAPKRTSQKALNKTLQKLVAESWGLLNDALDLPGRGLSVILDPEYYSRTIGMFEQNNVGIRLANPLGVILQSSQVENPAYVQISNAVDDVVSNMEDACCEEVEGFEDGGEGGDDDQDEEEEDGEEEEEGEEGEVDGADERGGASSAAGGGSASALETASDLLDRIEELGGMHNVFPPLDGTAFYATICKINHSCVPNVAVMYDSSPELGLFAKLVALKDIEPSEEFVQSYIDNSEDSSKRQKALAEYGFRCTCQKCLSEYLKI